MDNKDKSRSWFCVLNNPQDIYTGEPHEIAQKCLEDWINNHPTRTGAVAYCITENGLIHLHMVLEDSQMARFSALKKTYPKAHLEPTKGSKEQAEDYINKRGIWQEKGEQVLFIARFGEIKGNQGARKDLEIIEELILQGNTPNDIMNMSLAYRKYEKLIRDAYYYKRSTETPTKREVKVYWHVGLTGSGKSYTLVDMVEKHGQDNIYLVSDYEKGFDKYNGEPILFMDEFRGQMRYAQLLIILDGYKSQIHARYSNIISLWDEVHITSVLPPEKVYNNMVQDDRNLDTIDQLKRRINYVVYHHKVGDEYCKHEIPMSEYKDYNALRTLYRKPLPAWVRDLQETEGEQLPF